MTTFVQSAMIDDGTVATADIANNAVTTAKIADANVTPAKLSQPPVLGTVQTLTAQTSVFFSVPAYARRVTVAIKDVSLSGTALIRFRLGTSGGAASTGYLSAGSVISTGAATANQTAGFDVYTNVPNASYTYGGAIVFTLLDATNNVWAAHGVFACNNVAWTHTVAGTVLLSGACTNVYLTTSNGTDTLDNGTVNAYAE